MSNKRGKYEITKSDGSHCPHCNNVSYLFGDSTMPMDKMMETPASYLCFNCGYTGQIVFHPETKIGKIYDLATKNWRD